MRFYELCPTCEQNQKSFYSKAQILCENGSETLMSYNTPIITLKNGEYIRHWSGWTQTTGRHIKAFAGLNKKGFEALPYSEYTR